MAFHRRRTRFRRNSVRRMVAKAKNERFERRVRAIAAGPQETKRAYWPLTILEATLPAPSNYMVVFNPFTQLYRADSALVPTRAEVIGEEFIWTGLKMKGYIVSNVDRIMMGRISLISTDEKLSNLQEGTVYFGITNTVFDEEGIQLPTLATFDSQKVRVLHSSKFKRGANEIGQGNIWHIDEYYRTNQKKQPDLEESIGVTSERVNYLKNKQYYWVIELHWPGVGSVDYGQVASELASYVYFKDP